MDDVKNRLMRCFSAAFPSLPNADIPRADAATLEAWDSVASVTLFAMIEEEFGIEMEVHDSAELMSFAKIVEYLHAREDLDASRNAPL